MGIWWAMILPLMTMSATADFPVGRWTGELMGSPSALIGSATAHAPLLGNGYLGAVLSTMRRGNIPGNGSSVDLWLNSNANWDCQPAGQTRAPAALCSARVLGGLSISVEDGPLSNSTQTSFEAEQRISNGTLWTRRTAAEGSAIETETYIADAENVLVTDIAITGDGRNVAEPISLSITLFTYGPNRHVRPTTRATCAILNGDGTVGACSRRFHTPGTTGYHAPWSALAVRTIGATPSSVEAANATMTGSYQVSYVKSSFAVVPSSAGRLRVVVSLADNLLAGNDDDPAPAAAALARSTAPDDVRNASQRFWAAYYGASRVWLPSRPAIEAMWLGAQYASACSMPSAAVHARLRGRAPPPGLYGPFATTDFAFWNGDYTLDYNVEATFQHVHSSNHPELAASYFSMIDDWADAATANARAAATAANLSNARCENAVMKRFACHLAPWGYQSRDTSTYMEWNGPYAATLFIAAWEYTRNAHFARNATLPLLESLNAWSHCYLTNTSAAAAPGGYTLEDWSSRLPDELFEGRAARNPLSGLALMRRVATAHRDIANALAEPYPAFVDEIIAHLAPFRTVAGPEAVVGAGQMVWAAADNRSWYNSTPAAVGFPVALYPLWPAEVVSGLDADDETRRLAQASVKLYANLSCAVVPSPPFATCLQEGFGGLTILPAAVRALPARADETHGLSSREIVDALEGFLVA